MTAPYDALLVVSFGGPEGRDDVLPFLERVTRGRGVPRERLLSVAEHYYHFGGVSPITERTRELTEALERAVPLPVYLGNRHSRPTIEDALRAMKQDGARRAVAFATSAFSSYSSCRAYLEDIERARASIDGAPSVEKIPPYSAHPGYVETCSERLRDALAEIPTAARRSRAHVLFSAHSIPNAMADGCAYGSELEALAAHLSRAHSIERSRLVYQSRSGPPHVPWLGPDVSDALREIAAGEDGADVVVAPFGFVADHMEVVWDLDVALREEARALGVNLVRAKTANAHPRFVRMVGELIEANGRGAAEGRCGPACCPAPRRNA
jgi:protoporphyrin/coproporphyrin ferrochelatase